MKRPISIPYTSFKKGEMSFGYMDGFNDCYAEWEAYHEQEMNTRKTISVERIEDIIRYHFKHKIPVIGEEELAKAIKQAIEEGVE